MLLISTRKGLFAVENGRIISTSFLGENVTLAAVDATGGWYAALNLGHFGVKMKYSSDKGVTWEDRAVPTYPDGEMLSTGDGKPPTPATLKLIWSLEFTPTGKLWAGTGPGGLFSSEDGGSSWTLNRGLWDRPERPNWMGGGYDFPGIHSICIDPRDSKIVRIAVSTGGIWETKNDGLIWTLRGEGLFAEYMPPDRRDDPSVQDVHRMIQCQSSPDCLWLQHHNGVFKSTDDGLKWSAVPNVPPSVFGFGVAVHPNDPNTAWFAPAIKDECRVPVGGKLVIARTRDGGKTFDELRNGLPQNHAYDLIYRHALAIDSTGSHLAIGSTTGGVWTSDDQGDTWKSLEARLPPVHAVLFGG